MQRPAHGGDDNQRSSTNLNGAEMFDIESWTWLEALLLAAITFALGYVAGCIAAWMTSRDKHESELF